jgi:EAL domain-containing protein (putative c-di-GMP-specific phosphodiesterase class I)
MEVAIDVVQQIRLLGCKFALDDFGVGFSSLHYLKRLPVDYLKIDGSFVSRLHVDRDDQVLVRALVTIATAFGQKTVAEFVDNEQILVTLKELNVDYAQGFYIAKPASYGQTWPEADQFGSSAVQR